MKKLLSLALVVMFVLGIATMGLAEVNYVVGPDSRVLTSVHALSASMTLDTTISNLNRLFGFTYTDSAAGTGAIYDTTVALANLTAANLIAEISVAAGGTSTIMFPFPRNIVTSITYKMSTATGCMVIYYD